MAHGLGGTREMRLDSHAERFAAEGYACLVFDYRHFGASSGEPRQLLEPRRQLRDWAAAIAQGPFTDGVASSLVMNPRSAIKLTALAVADTIGSWLKREPITVALAGPPDSTALMTAPDAEPGFTALMPLGADPHPEVAARVALQIPLYRPGRHAKEVTCPVLVYLCEADSVAPPRRRAVTSKKPATSRSRPTVMDISTSIGNPHSIE